MKKGWPPNGDKCKTLARKQTKKWVVIEIFCLWEKAKKKTGRSKNRIKLETGTRGKLVAKAMGMFKIKGVFDTPR